MKKIIKNSQKAFTLIELLVVIAVIGVLAAGTLTAINPLQQIRRAQDTDVKNRVGQVASALQAYYTLNQYYPVDLAALVASGEIKTQATTGLQYARTAGNTCTTAPYTGCEVRVYGTLAAPLTGAANVAFCYKSSTNTSIETTVALCTP